MAKVPRFVLDSNARMKPQRMARPQAFTGIGWHLWEERMERDWLGLPVLVRTYRQARYAT